MTVCKHPKTVHCAKCYPALLERRIVRLENKLRKSVRQARAETWEKIARMFPGKGFTKGDNRNFAGKLVREFLNRAKTIREQKPGPYEIK